MVLQADVIVSGLIAVSMQNRVNRLSVNQLPEEHDRIPPYRRQLSQPPRFFARQEERKSQLQARSGGPFIEDEEIMIVDIRFEGPRSRILQAVREHQFRPAFH